MGPQPGATLSPRGHLTMSADILGCPNAGGEVNSGIQLVGSRDAVKYPKCKGQLSTTENHPASYVNSAEVTHKMSLNVSWVLNQWQLLLSGIYMYGCF